MKRLAVLLDGGFVKPRLRSELGRATTATDLATFVTATVALLPDHELFRAYYYDATPYDGTAQNPIDKAHIAFKKTPVYQDNVRLLDQAALLPNFAVRLGECVMQGWELAGATVDVWNKLPTASSQAVTPRNPEILVAA